MAKASPVKVDFYLLGNHVPEGKLKFTCRLVQKIYTLGKPVFILVESEEAAQRLDDLLWTFDQSSFLPHVRQRREGAIVDTAPITVGHAPPGDLEQADVLVSLLRHVPDCAAGFKRVAELVDNEPADKRSARERFRYYRDMGFDIETHEVSV